MSKPPKHSVLHYPEAKEAGLTEEQAMAKAAIDPAVKAMAITKEFNLLPEEQVHSTELMTELMKACTKVKGGDLGDIEAMLTAQAFSLDAIFQNLAVRAKRNMGEYTKTADLYLKLALKAQSQCRATAEALALLKNPQPFIGQANIANQLQVNNGKAAVEKVGSSPRLGHSEPQVLDALKAPARAREICD